MPLNSLLLLSALVAALSVPSLAGNVTFGKVYRSGEFVYDDRNLHAVVSPTQSRYRRSPCPENVPTIDPASIDLQLSGPSDYLSVRFSFDVSPKTITNATCKKARSNTTAGQWFQGSDRLMEFYRTAAAELGVMSAVLRKPPSYGLTIDTSSDPSKAVLTVNDVKEGSIDAYVCTVSASSCASVTTSFIIKMPVCNETTTTSTTSTSTTTTATTGSTTTSSPSTTTSTSDPSSTTTTTASAPTSDPKTSPTQSTEPTTSPTEGPTSTTQTSTRISTSDSRKTVTSTIPSTTSDCKEREPLPKIRQRVKTHYDKVKVAQQQASAALKDIVDSLRKDGRNSDADALENEFSKSDCPS